MFCHTASPNVFHQTELQFEIVCSGVHDSELGFGRIFRLYYVSPFFLQSGQKQALKLKTQSFEALVLNVCTKCSRHINF